MLRLTSKGAPSCGDRGGDVHNVVGVLMVRKLIVLDPNERRALRDVPLRAPLVAHPDAGLLETLNAFQAGRSHLALVTRHGARLRRAMRWLKQKWRTAV